MSFALSRIEKQSIPSLPSQSIDEKSRTYYWHNPVWSSKSAPSKSHPASPHLKPPTRAVLPLLHNLSLPPRLHSLLPRKTYFLFRALLVVFKALLQSSSAFQEFYHVPAYTPAWDHVYRGFEDPYHCPISRRSDYRCAQHMQENVI